MSKLLHSDITKLNQNLDSLNYDEFLKLYHSACDQLSILSAQVYLNFKLQKTNKSLLQKTRVLSIKLEKLSYVFRKKTIEQEKQLIKESNGQRIN